MKTSDFSQWNITNPKALLFFAQCLEEMLFHYGHDSIKVPALNFHYLCIETLLCIHKINEGIVDKANIKPLFLELSSMYDNDPIAINLYGEVFNNLFFYKDVTGEYKRDCKDLYKDASSESSIQKIRHTLEYLIDDMENSRKYFQTIKIMVSDIITKDSFDENDADLLYTLCRILLTELINQGYSHEYIYRTVLDIFYSTNNPVTNASESLNIFWNNFSFKEKEYSVILPLHKLRFLDHLKNFSNSTFYLNEPVTLLERGHNYSHEEINKRVYVMTNNFSVFGDKMVSIIGLHSAALESKDINNQLLNLWSIVEILIETERQNCFSKINQICNTLTSVLNASYIRTLLNQLILDLTHCTENFLEIIDTIDKGNDTTEKFVALLILDEYEPQKQSLLHQLDNYPVLQYRLNTYYNKLSSRSEIKKLLVNHRKKIEWQIMRIYRNRNLIVHDGTHFPYIDIIVQNLHFYVDTLIDTINAYANNGYSSINTIYTTIQKEELAHLLVLEKEENNTPALISDEFSSIILGNSYFEI